MTKSEDWSNMTQYFNTGKSRVLKLSVKGDCLLFDDMDTFIKKVEVTDKTIVDLIDLKSFKIVNNGKEMTFRILDDNCKAWSWTKKLDTIIKERKLI